MSARNMFVCGVNPSAETPNEHPPVGRMLFFTPNAFFGTSKREYVC